MAVLPLVIAPDERLKIKSTPVDAVTDDIRTLAANMLETMYANNGIGLAAVQVGVHKRVIVMDVDQQPGDESTRNPIVLINPEVVEASEDLSEYDEGCLSFPDQYSIVERPSVVTLRYLDLDGKQQELKADGLMATCIQHEIDHIDGIVFVDHISKVKRDMILRKLKKAKRLGAIKTDINDEVPV
ncbi:MAG: peptide deformylase [Rickettsiales bacterium]|nr:peptide deformylase [Rickettsiales bacterium]